MSKHTPGPWKVRLDHGRRWIAATKKQIADVTDIEVGTGNGEVDVDQVQTAANANLIAVSPELLAACKAMLAWGNRECMPQGGKNDAPWETMEAAVAKVEVI